MSCDNYYDVKSRDVSSRGEMFEMSTKHLHARVPADHWLAVV
jgi:hypothetical protein